MKIHPLFWSNVKNEKVNVTESTLKIGPLKCQNFFFIQNIIWIFPKIQSILPLVRPYPDKDIQEDMLITVGGIMNTNKQTDRQVNVPKRITSSWRYLINY